MKCRVRPRFRALHAQPDRGDERYGDLVNSDEDIAVFKVENDPTILAINSEDIGTDADFRASAPGVSR